MTLEMHRHERLERWATLIENCESNLKPFREVEFLSYAASAGMRQPNSPLALAFGDPVLRRAGLGSDRYGDGVDFFGLSQRQAHRVLCSCGYIGGMRAIDVAVRVRAIAERAQTRWWRPANPLPALARWFANRRPLAGFMRPA
jgi:hypothetical protein